VELAIAQTWPIRDQATALERTAGKQGDGRGAVVGAMCGQPRLVELYKMAASASGKYPFAFTIARIARQLQRATDARRRKTLRDAFENDEKNRRDFVSAEFIAKQPSYLSAATPARESALSCTPAPLLTPMAPMTLPPTISGLPPREAITSSGVAR
jgi:hypothetical protein